MASDEEREKGNFFLKKEQNITRNLRLLFVFIKALGFFLVRESKTSSVKKIKRVFQTEYIF